MKKGFTLIELLVVIGIIAMIVAIAIPNFLSARQRASDARKKSDMGALKTALRIYYNDYQKYPAGQSGTNNVIMGCGVNGTSACPGTCGADFVAGPTTGCENVYMKHLPTDFSSKYKYFQTQGGDDFCLTAALDNKSDQDLTTSQERCSTSCGANCPTSKYCLCAD